MSSVPALQKQAWQFYGIATDGEHRAVGEVHYVNAWLADQMTRLDWDVLIDGSPEWSVELPDGATITTTRTGENGEAEQDVTAASADVLELIDWDDTNVRGVTTNLFVAGQGDYIWDYKTDRWRVVSVLEKERQETIRKARERIPFIWPHPADPSTPDAPLFSVLPVLEELDWLNRQARTQSRQRVLISGIVGTADEFDKPGESTFWDQWNQNMRAKMESPDDLSPMHVSGPVGGSTGQVNLIKDGINWVIPDFGYDDVLDRRVIAAINRLAYGLPVPPEILLGMQAQSRATAFQVEENAYRAHIEPPAHLVAQVAQDALNELLDADVTVVPNPTNLLGRRNSVQDVKDAYDRGLVRPAYVREVLGIPEDEAPDPTVDGVPPTGSPGQAPTDPANVAADEPVTASAHDDLSDLLSDIDFHLSSELAGATVMATERARQRLGSAARSNPAVRNNPELKGLTSANLAHHLGYDGLVDAGVDIAGQIIEPIEAASRWWTRRVGEAWAQTRELVPGWSGQDGWVVASSAGLVEALTAHVIDTLDQPEAPPLDAEQIRSVVDAAAGGA